MKKDSIKKPPQKKLKDMSEKEAKAYKQARKAEKERKKEAEEKFEKEVNSKVMSSLNIQQLKKILSKNKDIFNFKGYSKMNKKQLQKYADDKGVKLTTNMKGDVVVNQDFGYVPSRFAGFKMKGFDKIRSKYDF